MLKWTPSLLASTNTSWSFQWTCLYSASSNSLVSSIPGRVADATTWAFENSLFLYGGFGSGHNYSSNAPRGYFNDIWQFSLNNIQAGWTHVKGSNSPFVLEPSLSSNTSITPPPPPPPPPSPSTISTQSVRDLRLKRRLKETEHDSTDHITISNLPPMRGASAYVRPQSSLPATVVIVGGFELGNGSYTTYFLDATRFNASYAKT
jgi:hypothetical protein